MSTPQHDEALHPREGTGRFATKPVTEVVGGMDALSAAPAGLPAVAAPAPRATVSELFDRLQALAPKSTFPRVVPREPQASDPMERREKGDEGTYFLGADGGGMHGAWDRASGTVSTHRARGGDAGFPGYRPRLSWDVIGRASSADEAEAMIRTDKGLPELVVEQPAPGGYPVNCVTCGDYQYDADLPVAGFQCGCEDDEDDEPDACSECGESVDDGEGWDGLCGECADRAESGDEVCGQDIDGRTCALPADHDEPCHGNP